MNKLLTLTWKKGAFAVIIMAALVGCHNVLSVTNPGACDAITLILAIIVVPTYLIICLAYTIINKLSNRGM